MRPEADHLDGSHGGDVSRRRHDQRRVLRQFGQQAGRVVQHLLDLAMGPGEELLHPLALGAGQLGGEVVDEEAVALVGRHPAGAGVGVVEVPLALQQGEVVADRRSRHQQAGGAQHRRRADRLCRLDVLLHHGLEDGRLAFVEHFPPDDTEDPVVSPVRLTAGA